MKQQFPVIFGLALSVLERMYPLRSQKSSLGFRLLRNFRVAIVALPVQFLLLTPLSKFFAAQSTKHRLGVVGIITPKGLRSIATFLLLDLSFYYWHRALHQIPHLWNFHKVHHEDADMDVSTAARFHVGEIFMSIFFRVFQIILIGVSPRIVKVYDLFFQMATLFHHSNLRLPKKVDRWLSPFIVCPSMHDVHHSENWKECNSNFSVIFSFWDTLHLTKKKKRTQKIGLPE